MKVGKYIAVALIWVIVVGLGFWLYKIIQDPVQFKKDYEDLPNSTCE